MTREMLIDREHEMLRQRRFEEFIGETDGKIVGSFYEDLLGKFHDGEIDEAELAFFIDLLPSCTRAMVYPAQYQTLRVDFYDDFYPPVSKYKNDWSQVVFSNTIDYGDRSMRDQAVEIDAELKTLWMSYNPNGRQSKVVELSFNEYGEPNFSLEFQIPQLMHSS